MPRNTKRTLNWTLTVVFLVALVMGPGPGALLVKAAPGEAPTVVLGIPVLYAWAVFWFGVMAGVVTLASRFLWSKGDGGSDG